MADARARVLVIEDDLATQSFVARTLKRANYRILIANDGAQGLQKAREMRPDLILLELRLPKMDGMAVLRGLRAEQDTVPVIITSALTSVDSRVAGLKAGGDDYLTKPYEVAELFARIEAVLRRRTYGSDARSVLRSHGIALDPVARLACVGASPLNLTPKEFDVLHYLMHRTGESVSLFALKTEVWHNVPEQVSDTYRKTVNTLSHKLMIASCARIECVRDKGYILRAASAL
jgi:two-component system OmpR family response regulator